MARIQLSADDLANTRFCTAPAPLMEAGLALAELQRCRGDRRAARPPWLDEVCRTFPRTARPLLDLVPVKGFGPQFLDPMATDVDAALDIVHSVPRRMLRADLANAWHTRPDRRDTPPGWLRLLAAGDAETLDVVVRALRDFYTVCIAPRWPAVRARFDQDIAIRGRTLITGGHAQLFGTLHNGLSWQDNTFAKAGRPVECALDGTGLLLMPSAFWTAAPCFVLRPFARTGNALLYPAQPAPVPKSLPGSGSVPDPLTALLGRTRAAVLRALRDPSTTSELAARLTIGIATASEHTKTLREADLVVSTRSGCAVRHALTPLGRTLISER